MGNKIFFLIRVILGALFVISGFEKLSGPSVNFLYVIQQYDILPGWMARLASVVFPWVELLVGISLVLGLWAKWALMLLALISCSLIVMVGQAIIRGLPLDSCGCFGELIHLPLKGVIVLDISILAATLACLRNINKAQWLSLDAFYTKK